MFTFNYPDVSFEQATNAISPLLYPNSQFNITGFDVSNYFIYKMASPSDFRSDLRESALVNLLWDVFTITGCNTAR